MTEYLTILMLFVKALFLVNTMCRFSLHRMTEYFTNLMLFLNDYMNGTFSVGD